MVAFATWLFMLIWPPAVLVIGALVRARTRGHPQERTIWKSFVVLAVIPLVVAGFSVVMRKAQS